MKIDIICLQHISFVNDDKEKVDGYQIWWLDPDRSTENIVGRLPQKRWLNPEQMRQFNITQVGTYDIECDMRGRIQSIKKA